MPLSKFKLVHFVILEIGVILFLLLHDFPIKFRKGEEDAFFK